MASRPFDRKSAAPKPGARSGAKPGLRKGAAREATAAPALPAAEKAEGGPERIAKVLARSGVASRRDAERMIAEGRISVNGKVIDSPALDVTRKDKILVDGTPLAPPEPPRLWMFHKPAGLVTTERDELGRPTVFEHLPEGLPRVMSVGRLDLNSEGLLLLTNDGELKRRLELPSTGWLRKYRVRINGRPEDADFNPLREGVVIDGEAFQPMVVSMDRQQGANAWLTVGIREGRNREVRRAMESVGYTVNRLIRVSYGPFQLGELEVGEVTEVRPRTLKEQLGLAETPDVAPTEGILRTQGTSGRSVRGGAAASGSPARARVAGAGRAAATASEERPRGKVFGAKSAGFTRDREETPARAGFTRGAARDGEAKSFRAREDGPRGGFSRGAARDGEDRPQSRGFQRRDDKPAGGGFQRRDDKPAGGGFQRRDDKPAGGGFARGAARDGEAKSFRAREDGPRGGFSRGAARDGEERPQSRGFQRRDDKPAGGGFQRRDDKPAGGGFARGAARDGEAKSFRAREDGPRGGFSRGGRSEGPGPRGPKPGGKPGPKGPRSRG